MKEYLRKGRQKTMAKHEVSYIINKNMELRAEFSDPEIDEFFTQHDIDVWRRKVRIDVIYDDEVLLKTELTAMRSMSWSEVKDMENGADLVTLHGINRKIRVLNSRSGVDFDRWHVFGGDDPHNPGQSLAIVFPDYPAGGEPSSMAFDTFMGMLRVQQNIVLDSLGDEIPSPVSAAVRIVEEAYVYTTEELAEKAGISQADLEKAERGEAVSTDILLAIAKATGTRLNIEFNKD